MANLIRRGNSIYIGYEIKDQVKSPPVLLDPDGDITITVWDSQSALVVDGATMTRRSAGLYFYIWQSSPGSETGDYTVEVSVTNAGFVSLSNKIVIFSLTQ